MSRLFRGAWYLQENRRLVLQGSSELRSSNSFRRWDQPRNSRAAAENHQDHETRHGDWIWWRWGGWWRCNEGVEQFGAQNRQERIVQQQLPEEPKSLQSPTVDRLRHKVHVRPKLAGCQKISSYAIQSTNKLNRLAEVSNQPPATDERLGKRVPKQRWYQTKAKFDFVVLLDIRRLAGDWKLLDEAKWVLCYS